jgi:hypothetical protein
MLITVIILFITSSSMLLIGKQMYFSKKSQANREAYYAADDAASCAILIDETYYGSDGLGIFPSSSTTNPYTSYPTYTSYSYIDNILASTSERLSGSTPGSIVVATSGIDALKCGQAVIFDSSLSSDSKFTVATATDFAYHFTNPLTGLPDIEYGQTSIYTAKSDLGIDPSDRTGTNHLYRCAKVTVNKTPSYRQIISQGYSSCRQGIDTVERAVVNTTVQ